MDLIADYQAMSEDEACALFIPAGEPGELRFNEKGNLWVAERLTERVLALQQ